MKTLIILFFSLSTTLAFADVCNRTPQITSLLVQITKKPCEKIEIADLEQINDFNLEPGPISLKVGDFNGMSSLKRLYLDKTQLKSIPEGLFRDLKSIQEIDLSNNELETLPSKLFRGLSSLEIIKLGNNKINSIPEDLFYGLNSLLVIHLYNNKINSVPEGTFKGLQSLLEIALDGNQITTLPSNLFQGLKSLISLYLNKNKLSVLPNQLLKELTSLVVVSFSENNLTTISKEFFHGLNSLQLIQLYNNEITSLPTGVFHNLSSLKELHLGKNQLKTLPSGLLQGLKSLLFVGLSNNQLTSLPEGLFLDLSSLELLYLHDNQLNMLSEDTFKGLNSLTTLLLYHNKLTSLPDLIFKNLTKLNELKLDPNLATSFAYNYWVKSLPLYHFYIENPQYAPNTFTLAATINQYSNKIYSVEEFAPSVESFIITKTQSKGEPLDQIYFLYDQIPHIDNLEQLAILRLLSAQLCGLVDEFCPIKRQMRWYPEMEDLNATIELKKKNIASGAPTSTIRVFDSIINILSEFFTLSLDYTKLRSNLPSKLAIHTDSYFSLTSPTLTDTAHLSLILHNDLLSSTDSDYLKQYTLPILKLKTFLSKKFRQKFWSINNDPSQDLISPLLIMGQAENLLTKVEVKELIALFQQQQFKEAIEKSIKWQLDVLNKEYLKNLKDTEPQAPRVKDFQKYFNYQVQTSLIREWRGIEKNR